MDNRYYRHFKGNYYEFLYEAIETETLEEVVVYRALYGERKVWVRPKAMFFENIVKENYSGPRYIPVGEDEVKDLI